MQKGETAKTFNRTTVECKVDYVQERGMRMPAFNRTTVECKGRINIR